MDYIERMRRLEVKEFFSSSFRNQEIYYAGLDAIVDEAVFEAKLGIVSSGLAKLVHPEKVIVHLEETSVRGERLTKVVGTVGRHQDKIKKLAFVGLHGLDPLRLRWEMNRQKVRRSLGHKTLDDLQYAKEWMTAKNS